MIVCGGGNFVASLHEGVVSSVNEHGEHITNSAPILTDKKLRDQLRKGPFAGDEGRAFHPACLGRDPAGAKAKTLFSSSKKKNGCTFRENTHQLCEECLGAWQEGGGQIGRLAKQGEIISTTHPLQLDCDTHLQQPKP